MPFGLVDAVLSETRTVQRRLRDLPSRVGVCFLLAMCLFPEIGCRLVWGKMAAGLSGMPFVVLNTKALRDLRRRLRSAPSIVRRVHTTGSPHPAASSTLQSLRRNPHLAIAGLASGRSARRATRHRTSTEVVLVQKPASDHTRAEPPGQHAQTPIPPRACIES